MHDRPERPHSSKHGRPLDKMLEEFKEHHLVSLSFAFCAMYSSMSHAVSRSLLNNTVAERVAYFSAKWMGGTRALIDKLFSARPEMLCAHHEDRQAVLLTDGGSYEVYVMPDRQGVFSHGRRLVTDTTHAKSGMEERVIENPLGSERDEARGCP